MIAMKRRSAFTLMELMVVISIIAVLISLLLPAVGRAKKSAQMAVSLSNIRQINLAGAMYKDTNKGKLPITLTYKRGVGPSDRSQPGRSLIGWCTWSYGGKSNDAWWATAPGFKKGYDVEASDRPLNPYMYPDTDWECPPATSADGPLMAATWPARNIQAKAFSDPSDKITHQRDWPKATPGLTGYQDVGTSYHTNMKWWDKLEKEMPGRGESQYLARMNLGTQRIALADSFLPSRFVWLNDQYADVIVNHKDAKFQLTNGYGDVNKSLMGFLDAHAAYLGVTPGASEASYSTDKYSFVFEALKAPGK